MDPELENLRAENERLKATLVAAKPILEGVAAKLRFTSRRLHGISASCVASAVSIEMLADEFHAQIMLSTKTPSEVASD